MTKTLAAYIETALWASLSDDGEPLDKRYSADDLAPKTLAQMRKDKDAFWAAAFVTLMELGPKYPNEQIAHDFWLTRNGHGAGFWDGDYPEPQASQLTKLAESFGEVSLYVGDDGKVYQS